MPELTPARAGTRPRNRRELVLVAAAGLFAERGYANVAMGDIANAVGMGPSALYRHFTSKQDVLATVLAAGLAPVHELVLGLDPADPAVARRLASCALDQRHVGLMWQREARSLSPEAGHQFKDAIREIGEGLAAYVRSARPELPDAADDLLAWSVLAVLTSPSFHHLDLPRPAYDDLLAELITTVVTVDLPVDLDFEEPEPAPGPGLTPVSRREQLLAQAVRMFAEQGYMQVGIEDIGNAVGIAGPSVYNHWPTKVDLLITALRRGAAVLAVAASTAYRQATDPADALRLLLRTYIELSHTHSETFSLLITDIGHLPDDERHAIRRAEHEYVSEWTHLLRLDQPHLDPVAARIRVHAVLSVAHDTARAVHLRGPDVPRAVEVI